MTTLTTAQMRETDRRCIEEIGIPGVVLMNNAGMAVFEQIDRGPVGIVCGKGNNGGDGYVVARLALLAGFEPRVVIAGDPEAIRGDAAVFLRVYEKLGGVVEAVQEAGAAAAAVASLSDCAVVVDALLGTGVQGEVHGPIRAAIEAWPRVRTIAVDVPSGMNADTGEPCGCCVKADVTVTFQWAKAGFTAPAAREYLGELVVADIGIPAVCPGATRTSKEKEGHVKRAEPNCVRSSKLAGRSVIARSESPSDAAISEGHANPRLLGCAAKKVPAETRDRPVYARRLASLGSVPVAARLSAVNRRQRRPGARNDEPTCGYAASGIWVLLWGLSLVIGVVFLGAAVAAAEGVEAGPAPLTAVLNGDRVDVAVGGAPFTSYRFAADQKYPYFWPVVGPVSGTSVTTESSEPYPHHHSLFFGCDRVNGGNYWQDGNGRGQIRSRGPAILEASGSRVVFTDVCVWAQPGQEPVMRDERRICITAPRAALRLIDFEITLDPLTDVRIEKTNHSLFSARMVPELSVTSGGTLVNAEGKVAESGTWGVASPWCDYYGARAGHTEGLAILQHPGNRWFPAKWFTRDYGFFSPTPMYWPEADYYDFPKGEKLTLRYRVVVHGGDTEAAGIAALFEEYKAETPRP